MNMILTSYASPPSDIPLFSVDNNLTLFEFAVSLSLTTSSLPAYDATP